MREDAQKTPRGESSRPLSLSSSGPGHRHLVLSCGCWHLAPAGLQGYRRADSSGSLELALCCRRKVRVTWRGLLGYVEKSMKNARRVRVHDRNGEAPIFSAQPAPQEGESEAVINPVPLPGTDERVFAASSLPYCRSAQAMRRSTKSTPPPSPDDFFPATWALPWAQSNLERDIHHRRGHTSPTRQPQALAVVAAHGPIARVERRFMLVGEVVALRRHTPPLETACRKPHPIGRARA